MDIKRVFLVVLDSFGIGEMPDADKFGDAGSNTLKTVSKSDKFEAPNLKKLGLFNIEGVICGEKEASPAGSFARMAEKSSGKDTTTGHWEMAGLISEKPMPTYPNGFPEEIIREFEKRTGRGVLCNKPYSGTDVIRDYGREQIETGKLIVYTSADSVFQIAAHEKYIGLDELYRCCEIAREMLKGEHGVGRVIARPYIGEYPDFVRTSNRHDYSLVPPKTTMLRALAEAGYDVIGVGKIYDIFAGDGVTKKFKTSGNAEGISDTIELLKQDFTGLCFVNLVDFDMLYGHRNNIDGYANAISEFDKGLKDIMSSMKDDDILIITADHGCDPGTQSTDHSREYVMMLAYGKHIKPGVDLKTRDSFADIGASILEIFGVKADIAGKSFAKEVLR